MSNHAQELNVIKTKIHFWTSEEPLLEEIDKALEDGDVVEHEVEEDCLVCVVSF